MVMAVSNVWVPYCLILLWKKFYLKDGTNSFKGAMQKGALLYAFILVWKYRKITPTGRKKGSLNMEEKLLNITFQNLDKIVPGCVIFSKEASTDIFQSLQSFHFYFSLIQTSVLYWSNAVSNLSINSRHKIIFVSTWMSSFQSSRRAQPPWKVVKRTKSAQSA